MRNPGVTARPAAESRTDLDVSPLNDVRYPGLTQGAGEISGLTDRLPKELSVFSYKQTQSLLWVLLLGGTGTGKSTIFNALCGQTLSDTGVERPKTRGPIAFAHDSVSIDRGFPFSAIKADRIEAKHCHPSPCIGAPGTMLVVKHHRDDLSHIILVDTPDLDSLELTNRKMVEDLYLLSDVIIFITSQEKYADDVPFQFLNRIHEDRKLYFLIVNKAEPILTREEALATFRTEGVDVREDRFMTIPYFRSEALEQLTQHEAFRGCASDLLRTIAKSQMSRLLRTEKQNRVQRLVGQFDALFRLLKKEGQAAEKWLGHLDNHFKNSCRDLFSRQERQFAEESREYLQQEIRRLYARYDLLGTPRRLISQIVLSPFRMLGFGIGRPQESHKEALLRIRRRTDLSPVQAAIESFNRTVLDKLSPHDDTSKLYSKLREPGVVLTGEDIRKLVWLKQDELIQWLEGTFAQLAKGIPKSKEWGIYSTSILWGGLILSLETAVGGGISLLEAVLDSAIAPFVTKGAVELFAYRELQLVARELGRRYQEGMVSVVGAQRDRYAAIVRSLLTSDNTRSALESLQRSVAVSEG